jgi:uncharacterized protein with PQ loop repeat
MIDLTLVAIVGGLTLLFSILIKAIGFPDQMLKNYKLKSTKGVSTLFYVLTFVSYILWVFHGILQKDRILIIGQGLGVITTAIIIGQIFVYRNKD